MLDALDRYYERDNANVHRGIHELSNRATAAYEGARARVARFLKRAKREEIILTRGTTEAINLVANAWGAANLRRGTDPAHRDGASQQHRAVAAGRGRRTGRGWSTCR